VVAELSQILYWRWDPIGVSGDFPQTRGEYDGYLGDVVQVLESSPEEIAAVLESIERHSMGGPLTSAEHRLDVAAMVSRWWRAERAGD
jgi:hypothetical protein